MYTHVRRRYTFSAAHRLEGHPKCSRLHGHNYVVEVLLTARELRDGMVVDFGRIDDVVNPIIEVLDHRYLVSMENINRGCIYYGAVVGGSEDHTDDIVLLPIERTTAELIAEYIMNQLSMGLADEKLYELMSGIVVRVHENERSYAQVRSDI